MKKPRIPLQRRGLAVFLLLLTYDGAIRKWVLPGAEQIVFVAKDAILFALIIHSLSIRRAQNSIFQQSALILFTIYAAWVALEVGNIALPNVLVGIWGMKSHLLYSGLILLVPLAFRCLDDLFHTLVKIYPWVVIPVCSLAFIQLASPPDSFVNLSVKGGTEGMAYFGDENLIRVTGTFSYIAGMAVFVEVSALLGMALYIGGIRTHVFLVGLGFAMACLPATGTRSVLVVVILGAAILLLSALVSRMIGLFFALKAITILAILVLISVYSQESTWKALGQRVEGSRSDENRTITIFTSAFDYMGTAGVIGYGTGAANLGSLAFTKDLTPFSWLPIGNQFEEESGRIVLELGVIGWMFSLSMRVAMFLWATSLTMAGRTRTVRRAAVLAMPVMALGVHQGNGVFGASFQPVYYWFCVALLSMAEYEHRLALRDRMRMPIRDWRGTGA